MIKFLQFVKGLIAEKKATAAQKAEAQNLYDGLSAEEKSVVEADLAAVKGLSEEEPEPAAQSEIAKAVSDLLGPAFQAEMVKMRSEFSTSIDEFLADQKAQRETKAGLFNPEVKEQREALNVKLRKTLQASLLNDEKALLELSGLAGTKELTTDDQSSPYGGYVVDRELSAEIRHLTTEYGVARREMTTVQLSKNRYAANNLVTDVTVYWVDEAATIGSTQVVLGQEDLELKKLGAIATLTSELLADEEIDLFAFIASRVAEGFARAEDRAFFIGDGSSGFGSFTGILNATDVNEVVMGDAEGETGNDNDEFYDLTADDLLDMQDASPQVVSASGKYYMHRSIKNLVRKLKDSQGMPIYQAISEGGPNTIWGRPVVEVEVLPSVTDSADDTPFVIYGDLRRACILGFKGAIAVKRFDAGSVRNVANDADINLITTDREAIRWTERVGYIRIIPSAITVLKTAASGS
jgi:HK97 family phage major capsid protein